MHLRNRHTTHRQTNRQTDRQTHRHTSIPRPLRREIVDVVPKFLKNKRNVCAGGGETYERTSVLFSDVCAGGYETYEGTSVRSCDIVPKFLRRNRMFNIVPKFLSLYPNFCVPKFLRRDRMINLNPTHEKPKAKSLKPTPHTPHLHPTPHTLYPIPYTLQPSSYDLNINPKPWTCLRARASGAFPGFFI